MAVTSGFFNSVNHDRLYNADQMSLYFEGLVSNGVFESVGERLQVTAPSTSGMSVDVGTGRAIVQSHWIKNDSKLNLTIEQAHTSLNRLDAIAIRYDVNARAVSIVVKTGTPAAMPYAPVITRNADVYELYIAAVHVAKGTTAITQDMIDDLRPSNRCGWVTGLINQVDTSDLFDQWEFAYMRYYLDATAQFDSYMANKQREFDEWFDSLTSELRVDTTLHSYQNTVTVPDNTSNIMIGIDEYAANSDTLFAYSNGVLLVQGIDYTVSGTGSEAKIMLTTPLKNSNEITFVVLKSVIGENSGAYISGQAALESASIPVGLVGNAEREDV